MRAVHRINILTSINSGFFSGMKLASLIARGLSAVALTCVSVTGVAATLDDLSFTSLPGDRVQIKLQLSEPAGTEPLSFTIDNPARIALDLPGVALNLDERSKAIGVGNAESVTAVETADRTRVVIISRS